MNSTPKKRKRVENQIIRLGKNTNGEICVQIMLNIPLTDLIKDALALPIKPSKEAKK